jgi:UDP-N-acetylmuramoylalanine--D-glutamate ligase
MSENYKGRRVLVLGLGQSGVAASDFLWNRGAIVTANDHRSLDSLGQGAAALAKKGVSLVLGEHPVRLADAVELIVASPGVPLDLPLLVEARRRSVPVWGELELGFREISGTTVAVTGTKGKSTTALLVAAMLRASGQSVKLAGNIGRPLVSELSGATPETTFVLEVSSFQLTTIERFRPHVAVLLDVTPDHLDWHPSFEDYVDAKRRLFANQEESDWAVVFGGSRLTVNMASKVKSRKMFFDLDCLDDLHPHVHAEGPWVVRHESGQTTTLTSLEDFQLLGRHNRLNAMAASATASLLGVCGEDMAEALEHFEGLPHALEKVADIGGVRFYNDSKATNIQAVRAALESFDGGILLILGGRFKGGDFRDLRDLVGKKVRLVLAIGETREAIADALEKIVPVEVCDELEAAVREAHRRAIDGDIVLLSPGGSSFDMFRNYRDRGERFRKAVLELGEKGAS